MNHSLAIHPRCEVHYTPTYASWLNEVEIWRHLITEKVIRRGTLTRIKALTSRLDQFV